MRFYETIHDVYFDDLDAFHILHNARHVLLFERTIGSFWRTLGWDGQLDFGHHPDQSQVVRANHIEYLRPVSALGQVRVRIWIEALGRTSLTFGFRLLPMDEDVDYAKGTRTMVRVNAETRRPEPWSDGFRERLAPYRRDLDGPSA